VFPQRWKVEVPKERVLFVEMPLKLLW